MCFLFIINNYLAPATPDYCDVIVYESILPVHPDATDFKITESLIVN